MPHQTRITPLPFSLWRIRMEHQLFYPVIRMPRSMMALLMVVGDLYTFLALPHLTDLLLTRRRYLFGKWRQ